MSSQTYDRASLANRSGPALIRSGAAAVQGLAAIAVLLAPPIMRIALALPFIRSGLTRWDGFLSISPSTLYLFENMFRLHLFGGEFPLPFPALTAHLVAVAELALPALLILGLGTRLAALGLLVMTGVIQLVVPDGWANFHLYWAAIALGIVALGGGPVSLDQVLGRRLGLGGTAQRTPGGLDLPDRDSKVR